MLGIGGIPPPLSPSHRDHDKHPGHGDSDKGRSDVSIL
jgi:hypothetical protein